MVDDNAKSKHKPKEDRDIKKDKEIKLEKEKRDREQYLKLLEDLGVKADEAQSTKTRQQ